MSPSRLRAWHCPVCGRHVPPRRLRCHCGQPRLAGRSTAARAASRWPGRLLVGLLIVLPLCIGALFYYGWRPRWAADPSAGAPSAWTTRTGSYPSLPATAPEDASPFGRPDATEGQGGGVGSLPWPSSVVAASPAAAPGPGVAALVTSTPPVPTPAPSPDVPSTPPAEPPGEADKASPFEKLERRAVLEITPRVTELATLAERVDARMRDYVQNCRPAKITMLPQSGAGRDWPVPLLTDPSIAPARGASTSGSDLGGCVAAWEGVRRAADEVAAVLESLHVYTRARGLLPGHLRDALAERELEGWERYD